MKKNKILLSLLIFFALIPRLVVLFTNRPFSYLVEEGYDFLVAKNIVVDHIFYLVGQNGGKWSIVKGPAWQYLLAGAFIFGNGDPFAGKILVFLFSISAIVFSFLFLKSKFDFTTALFVGLSLSVSPWLVETVGLTWPPYAVVLPLVLFLFSLFNVFQKKDKYLVFLLISIGFIAQFEVAITVFLFLQIILLLPFLLINKYISAKIMFIAFFALLIIAIPNIYYEISHNFASTKGIYELSNHLFKIHTSAGGINVFWQKVEVFIWDFRSAFSPNILLSLSILTILLIGTYLYIFKSKIKKEKKLFVAYLALTPIIKFLILIPYSDLVPQWHLLDLSVFYCFLFGIISSYLCSKKYLKIIIISVIALLLIISFERTKFIYKSEVAFNFGMQRLRQAAPVEFIYQNAKKRPFNVTITSKRGSFQTTGEMRMLYPSEEPYDFDYLFWWYGTKKYGYLPSLKMEMLQYVIVLK